MEEEKENLISIDEFISRAKSLGVDFGKGDPKNRLRYYVKLGLLPHAQRKSFNGLPANGAYPLEVLSILVNIDRKIKEGKSIRQIKRELEIEKEKEKEILQPPVFPQTKPEVVVRDLSSELSDLAKEKFSEFKKEKFNLGRPLKIFFSLLFLAIILFSFFGFGKMENNLATLINIFPGFWKKMEQISFQPELKEIRKEIFVFPTPEPYLTLNVETEVKGNLILNENLLFKREEYQAMFNFERLSENRTYSFPDISGTICLTTGNCALLFGEVTSKGGTPHRLAKFSKKREISDSSINDLSNGISITIDERGNVGVGTQTPRGKLEVAGSIITNGPLGIGVSNPQYELHVRGRIQASGDICTDLAGKRCLSTLPIFTGGGFAGLQGTGMANYLALWSDSSALSKSIIYQGENKIGINTTEPNEILTLSGALSLAKISEPATTTDYGKLYVGTNGKLYYKDDFGIVYDLTLIGISGTGQRGQIAFWNSPGEILGDNSLFWDIDNKRLGIGTTTPSTPLEVVGTIKMTGFQLATTTQIGYVLTSINEEGVGVWLPAPSGTLPSGLSGQTLRHDGSAWVPNYFLYNTGSQIGIGTTSTNAVLTVAGNSFFQGPLTISTSSFAQLILKYDNENYLNFSVSSTSSEILASKNLILNSLTGELKFFNTSLKKGDKILRSSIPIFKFPISSETSSTTFVTVTKEISTTILNSILPPPFEGSQRKFAFLINFADDIPLNASSTWKIDFTNNSDIDFEFPGQNLPKLDEGVPHLKDNVTGLLDDNWILKVKVPDQNYKLRVFNLFLLVYDQIQ